VNLLSTEAEYVAISKSVEEVKFVYYFLCNLQIKLKLSIMVRMDNIGAISMSENALTGFHTWHVDTRYHFVQEFIEDDFIKIEVVLLDGDCSDLFKKKKSGVI
jgi:hypothetical protein